MNLTEKNFAWLILFVIIFMGIFNPLPTSQTMAQSLPSSVVQELIVRQAQAWEDQDAQAIADDFAENAVFIAAGFKFVGKEQVRKAAQDYFQQFHHTSVEIKRTIIDGDRGAVEWDWRDQNRKTGKSGWAEDAIIFELANGKIIYWREYIEKKQ
ncbi:MAG: hypothetical protein RLZZ04_4700 [Cyanobacteriota bacterium]